MAAGRSEVWKETWGTRGLPLPTLGYSVSQLVMPPGGKEGFVCAAQQAVEDSQPRPAPGLSLPVQHLASGRPGVRREGARAPLPPSPGAAQEDLRAEAQPPGPAAGPGRGTGRGRPAGGGADADWSGAAT